MFRTSPSLAYGPEDRQKLDLYWPSGAKDGKYPLIVFFYGGSWKSGNRGLYKLWGRGLASLGAVVAVPDYRLYPEVLFPAFNEDGAMALQFLLEDRERFRIDPNRIALMGHSAGAHLAASLAMDPAYLAKTPAHRITHLCPISGPLSGDPANYDSVAAIFEGSDALDRRPIKLIPRAKSLPKTLLLHGAKDTTVGAHNSVNFANALRDAGGDVELEVFDPYSHVDILVRAFPLFRFGSPVWPKIRSFLGDL